MHAANTKHVFSSQQGTKTLRLAFFVQLMHSTTHVLAVLCAMKLQLQVALKTAPGAVLWYSPDARMKPRNSGLARPGRDLNSGWNCSKRRQDQHRQASAQQMEWSNSREHHAHMQQSGLHNPHT